MRTLGGEVGDLQHSRGVFMSDKARLYLPLDHSSRAVNRILHSAHT